MSEARKSTFRNFSDTFTLGQCDEVFKRNGFERHTAMTDNYCLVDSWDVADAIMTLEADRDALQADALWAATHRSELIDLRDAFAKAEAEIATLKADRDALLAACNDISEVKFSSFFLREHGYDTTLMRAAIKQAESH